MVHSSRSATCPEICHSEQVGALKCASFSDAAGMRTPSTREPSPTEPELPTLHDQCSWRACRAVFKRSNCVEFLHMDLDSMPASRPLAEFVSDVARRISEIQIPDDVPKQSEMTQMMGSPSRALRRQCSAAKIHVPFQATEPLPCPCRPQSAPLQRRRGSKTIDVKSCTTALSGIDPKIACKTSSETSLACVFEAYASGRKRMYWKDFERMCRASFLFDSHFMTDDGRRVFNQVLSRGHRSIGYQQFEALLKDVAYHRQGTPEQVHRTVIDGLRA
jgi:hypothetical protein